MDLMPILNTIFAAFVPVAVTAVKERFLPSIPKPENVSDYIALIQAEAARFEAISKIEAGGGASSVWVEDIRKLQRPMITYGVTIIYLYLHVSGSHDTATIDLMTEWVWGFLFGERYMMYARKR